jgi:hypothetical protein
LHSMRCTAKASRAPRRDCRDRRRRGGVLE